MKKLLATIAVASIMGVSAMAGYYPAATIDTIKVRADGSVSIVVTPDGGGTAALLNLDGVEAEAKKSILAALLTAKASTSPLDVRFTSGTITEVGY